MYRLKNCRFLSAALLVFLFLGNSIGIAAPQLEYSTEQSPVQEPARTEKDGGPSGDSDSEAKSVNTAAEQSNQADAEISTPEQVKPERSKAKHPEVGKAPFEFVEASPGEVVTFDYHQASEVFIAEVYSPKGNKLGTYRSFPVHQNLSKETTQTTQTTQGEYTTGRIFIPIASTADPGTYKVLFVSASGDVMAEHELEVVGREFRREIISLNYSLSELRSSDDPEKYNQAVQIQKIYGSFNPERTLGSLNFLLPLPERESGAYRITSFYGDRRIFSYSDDRRARSVHTGIDFAAPVGTDVLAAESGRVVLAEDRIISGYSVVIEHLPGVYTVYFHLDSLSIRNGDTVNRGSKIGTVGKTGLATGPHLHWEVRVNGVAVDPAMLTQID